MRTETFQTARPLVLDVRLPRGDVEVETGETAETTVVLEGSSERALRQIGESRIELVDRGDHDELVVDCDTEDIGFRRGRLRLSISFDRHDAVRVRIRAPHGATLKAQTASADVRAEGRYGAVDVRTASGDVAVGEAERDVEVKVASGDIRVERVGGSLRLNSAAGDIRSGAVGGNVEIHTAAGDVHVEEAGGSVNVKSASGDVRVGSVTQGKVDLKSLSGDLLVGVRRGSRVWLDVKTVTGDARSELDSGGEDDGDGPLVELKATAMSGDIRIVRA